MFRVILLLAFCFSYANCLSQGGYQLQKMLPVTLIVVNNTNETINEFAFVNPNQRLLVFIEKIKLLPGKKNTGKVPARYFNIIKSGDYVLKYTTDTNARKKIPGDKIQVNAVHNENEWSLTVYIEKY